MKLAMVCVAALSVVGCAGVEGAGGGQGEGIDPAKTLEFDPSDAEDPLHPVVDGMKQVGLAQNADYICKGCEIVVYNVATNEEGIDEVRVVKDGGFMVCRIYVSNNEVIVDECGANAP